MSNTTLFSSPLGHTYFSVFGEPAVISERGVSKSLFSVIRFYKEKERDRAAKKDNSMSSVQVWSIFILLIMNEFSIGRNQVQITEHLKDSLSTVETQEIPLEKMPNYICCSKIINVIVEYLRRIQNPKNKEREAIIFINTFFQI